MLSDRDAQITEWIGRVGAVGAEHVSQRFGMAICPAYKRLSLLVEHGLIEYRAILHRRPGMYSATRMGLRWQGLGRLSVFQVRPVSYEHAWHVATAATALHRELPDWRLIGEREVVALEAEGKELFASAVVRDDAHRFMRRRPDLALESPSGRLIALEVELSIKTPVRLQKICRSWARAQHVGHVYYLAESRTRESVLRAVEKTRTGDRITVLALEDVAGIAEREAGRDVNQNGTSTLPSWYEQADSRAAA